jgi:shikimate dehydrogenase
MKIVLIGFMGAGKSTVAKAISSLSGMPVIECDEEIVKKSSLASIQEIFSKEGEAHFRNIEAEVLLEALNSKADGIISTGGGVIESPLNRQALEESKALIIALDVPFEIALERAGDPTQRPILQDTNAAKERYENRQSVYLKAANLIIPTQFYQPDTIAKGIYSCLKGEDKSLSNLKVLKVIGDPVGHSLSPAFYGAEFLRQEINQNTLFLARRVKKVDIKNFVNDFRVSIAMKGLAVTIPLKEAIIPYLDNLSEEAKFIGAVNTVIKDKDGKLLGCNTDFLGILNPLSAKTAIKEKSIAIIGAGGTARAAAYAVKSQGAKVTIINRSEASGVKLLNDLNLDRFKLLSDVKDLKEYDIIINTTPVGLSISENQVVQEPPLFLSNAFASNSIVMDVVYRPAVTPFLEEATKAGADIITGQEMFIAQWQEQYKIMID